MGERKDYFITNVSDVSLQRLSEVLNEDIVENIVKENLRDSESYPAVGRTRMWQPNDPNDFRCVSVYEETNAVHAVEIDEDSRLGKLLEELQQLAS